ncbi:zinc finger CCCH domain-containing protein 13-like [Colletes gigas]|uniref:zinc finger CCCH domain-containing protein 13-like n=1 Tax=Colletes gigas TaxID=935657 RepID=UPI001C9AD7C9|nr:zinc finger CCCH domain-containing protein 13-like [Colletes gigas]
MWSTLISSGIETSIKLREVSASIKARLLEARSIRSSLELRGATRSIHRTLHSISKYTKQLEKQEQVGMRRTRHVALPVRAWQYMGLLIVSLACLTLGLVSRDKEGRAGSLAGPELEHRAPHEVDACPNLNPFTKLPSCSILEQDPARVPKISGETASVRSSQIPVDRRISRSRNLDHVSRTRTDRKSGEKLARRGPNLDDNSSRLVRSSRSLDLDDSRLTTRSLDRRSRVDHREASTIGMNERRERLVRSNDRFDIRDRRLSTTDRDHRLEIRERRSRSLDHRASRNPERRINGNLENDREDRRNRIVYRAERRVDDRRSVSRASNSNYEENRRNVRSVSRERQVSGASRDQDRRSLIRTTENIRRLDSRSPGDVERTTMIRRVDRQISRSLDRENSRTERDFADQRLSRSRGYEASRERKPLARSMKLESTDFRRENTVRNVQSQDRMRQIARRESRSNLDRRFERREQRDARNQRRGMIDEIDRRLNARLNEKRETSLPRSSGMGNSERRESNWLDLAREKRDSERRVTNRSNNRMSLEKRSIVAESVNKEDFGTNRWSLERSRNDNIRRNRLNLARESVKRDTERRSRDLSNDRRSSERKSPVSESEIPREVRTDRRLSTLNSLERRERTNRLNLARENIKRDTEGRARDLSNDRRSSERKSQVLEPAIRREIRTDRRLSTFDSVERLERTNRLNLARETVKRDTERRSRGLSNDRRSSERKSPVSESEIPREVRTDRRLSTLNRLERRERTNRLNLARENIKRDAEGRARDLSNDRRSSERKTQVLEPAIRREIRTDRRLSTFDSVERLERTNRLNLARETVKRDTERRSRDLSNDRRSSERKSPVSESEIPREVRTDRRLSTLNSLERRERTNRLNLARENIKRDAEGRARDLSNDRRSSERKTQVLEPAIRREIRTDRRLSTFDSVERLERTNRLNLARETVKRDTERRSRDSSNDRRSSDRKISLELRERTNKLNIARESRATLTGLPETVKRDTERRVRDSSNDRRSSERRSTILESSRRQEIRTNRRLSERSRLNFVDQRERTNALYIARESRIPLTRSYETAKRDLERRFRDLPSDRRSSERRSTVLQLVNQEEVRTRTDRHSRLVSSERRDRTSRLYITSESVAPSMSSLTDNHNLARRVRHSSSDRRDRSLDRRQLVDSKRSSEATALEHRNDRRIEAERSQKRSNLNRLHRSSATILNDPRSNQREQRLTEKTLRSKPLNDMKRSRLVQRLSFSDKGARIFSNLKDSVDLNAEKYVKSSRVNIPSYSKEENSVKYAFTFDVLRQALVIGLCALYSLSIFRGKQSFVSTVVRQASRVILW